MKAPTRPLVSATAIALRALGAPRTRADGAARVAAQAGRDLAAGACSVRQALRLAGDAAVGAVRGR
jgi:hypothetical protein